VEWTGRNKCRGGTSLVRRDNKLCGSIRPSTERGAEVLQIEPGHVSIPDPCLGHGTSSPRTLLWGGPELTWWGPNPIQQPRATLLRGSGLCVHGSCVFWARRHCLRERHLNCSRDTPRVFSAWLRVAAQTSCLHTVARGTPNPGYRQWPPGSPQGRMRACRWGQSLTGDQFAAPAHPLMQLLPARLWSR
jgi:hypothetical protein